jgi:thiamine-phosphate pyrophosphorylase
MKLIVISPSQSIENENRIVTSLFEHGLGIFHIRKPTMSTRAMREYIEAIPEVFHSRVVIHSHHQLALKYKLKGIHLTRHHQKRKFGNWLEQSWIKLRRPNLSVSVSFNKLTYLYENKKTYSYALLGPIYERLDGSFSTGFNAMSLETAIRKNAIPIVARGGISLDKIEQLQKINSAGVSLQSLIWKSANPLEQYIQFVQTCRELGLIIE